MMPSPQSKDCRLALFIIKPEARTAKYGNVIPKKVYEMFAENDLEIIAQKELIIDEGILRSYQTVLNKPSEYGEEWKHKMIQVSTETNIPALVLLVECDDAINKCTQIKKAIREGFVDNSDPLNKIVKNFVHCTDRFEEVLSNIQVLFPAMLKILNQKLCPIRNDVCTSIKYTFNI